MRELSVWWNPSQAVNAKRTRENQLSQGWEGISGPGGTGTVAALFLLGKTLPKLFTRSLSLLVSACKGTQKGPGTE